MHGNGFWKNLAIFEISTSVTIHSTIQRTHPGKIYWKMMSSNEKCIINGIPKKFDRTPLSYLLKFFPLAQCFSNVYECGTPFRLEGKRETRQFCDASWSVVMGTIFLTLKYSYMEWINSQKNNTFYCLIFFYLYSHTLYLY